MTFRHSIAVLMSVVITAVALGASPAQAVTRPVGLIIGDSVTARYNDTVGDSRRGWWSMLAEDGGWTPVRSAESGSGVIRRGRACQGTLFRSRTDAAIRRQSPDFIIIEGGRNDLGRCLPDGSVVGTTLAEIRTAWRTYLASVRSSAAAAGVPADRVYVFSPWGQKDTARAHDVRSVQRGAARAQGFTWISTGIFTTAQTVDGSHPNLQGNEALWDQLAGASDLDTRFRRQDGGGSIRGKVLTPSGKSVQTNLRVTAESSTTAQEAVTTVGSHGTFDLTDLTTGVHGFNLFFPWQDSTANVAGTTRTVSPGSTSTVTLRTRVPCSRTFVATRLGDRAVRLAVTTSGRGYGVDRPSGSVVVTRHGRTVARFRLPYGKATITATGQTKGSATYTARYSGDCWAWSRTASTKIS